jgi:hypothetical protein
MKILLAIAVSFLTCKGIAQRDISSFKLMQDTVYMEDTLIAGESYRLEWDRTEPNVHLRIAAFGAILTSVSSNPDQDAYLCTPHAGSNRVMIATRRVKGKTEIKDSLFVFQVKQP